MDQEIDIKEFIGIDTSYVPDFEIVNKEIRGTATILDIKYPNSMGDFVSAYIVKPQNISSGPGIHFIHWLETEATDSNRSQFLPHAVELANNGIISILPDCFWSLDKDKFKENPQQYTKNWWKTDYEIDSQIVRKQVIELCYSHNILLSLPEVEKDRVGLVAHDFGAMTGVLLTALNYKYNAYIFIAFTARFTDWFRFGSKMPEEDPDKFQAYVEKMSFLDPKSHIGNIDPNPILMQFGDDDFYVPKKVANELYEKAGSNKEIKWYSAKHGMNDQTFQDMKAWICEKLLK